MLSLGFKLFHRGFGYELLGRPKHSAESALIRHTVLPFTESDDTRCCDNIICPPEDGHVDARKMSKIVM
jgi:hypothetical protein